MTKDTISLIVLATILFFPVARFAAACSVKGTRPVPASPVEAVLFCPVASTAPAGAAFVVWTGLVLPGFVCAALRAAQTVIKPEQSWTAGRKIV